MDNIIDRAAAVEEEELFYGQVSGEKRKLYGIAFSYLCTAHIRNTETTPETTLLPLFTI